MSQGEGLQLNSWDCISGSGKQRRLGWLLRKSLVMTQSVADKRNEMGCLGTGKHLGNGNLHILLHVSRDTPCHQLQSLLHLSVALGFIMKVLIFLFINCKSLFSLHNKPKTLGGDQTEAF